MEDLIKSIDNIDLIEEDIQKEKEIRRILSKLSYDNYDSYLYYYLKGYLWYNMPNEGEVRTEEVVTNLEKSIELNNHHLYSHAYLAYFYFDSKNYQKVIEILRDKDLTYFEKRDQLWQSLKLEELMLVSELELVNEIDNKLSTRFLQVISSYMYLPESDVAVPSELVNAVIRNKKKKGILAIAANVHSLINSKSQKRYFDEKSKSEIAEICKTSN